MKKSHGNLHEVSFKSLNPMKIPWKPPHVSHVFHPKKTWNIPGVLTIFPRKGRHPPLRPSHTGLAPLVAGHCGLHGAHVSRVMKIFWSRDAWDVYGRYNMIYWDLLGFVGVKWDLLGFVGICWGLMGFIGIYWDLLGFNGISLGFIGIYDGILMVVYLWHILEY